MSDVFISYSRRDSDFAKRLTNRLTQLERDVWIDWEDIPRAADWLQEIFVGIEGAETFVFIVSSNSLKSEICNYEVEHAIKLNKRIIPLIREDVFGDTEKEIAGVWFEKPWEQVARDNWTALKHLNWIFFNDDDKFEDEFAALVTALEQDLPYIKLHTRLLVRARDWEQRGRNPSLLLTGDEITEAEAWLATPPKGDKQINPDPTPLHREYITASRQAEDERKRIEGERLAQIETLGKRTNQFRLASTLLGVLILIALIAVGFAVVQLGEAQDDANVANTQVAVAGATLTPVDAILAEANEQVNTAVANADRAATDIAEAGETLTPVGSTLEAANAEVEAAVQTLTPIPPTLTQAAITVEESNTREEISTTFADALFRIRQNTPGDSEEMMIEITESYPDEAFAWQALGLIQAELGDLNMAVQSYTRAIELDPEYTTVYLNRSIAYDQMGDIDAAIADLTRVLELEPDNTRALLNRSALYTENGNPEDAIDDLDRLIDLEPDNARAYVNRGSAYDEIGEYDAALADYDRAIELNPDNSRLYNNRGLTYFNLGDTTAALADYERAIQLDPTYTAPYFNRAMAYMAMRQYENAISDFDRVIELDPTEVSAYFERGEAHNFLNNYDAAIDDFSQVIVLDPENGEAYARRALAYATRAIENPSSDDILADLTRALDDWDRAEALDYRFRPEEAAIRAEIEAILR